MKGQRLTLFSTLLVFLIPLGGNLIEPAFAQHVHGGDGTSEDKCASNFADFVAEINAGRAYLMIHTDDGEHPTNTGADDLLTPGEIRGQFHHVHGHENVFRAELNATNQVLGDLDPEPWEDVTVEAIATLTFDPNLNQFLYEISITEPRNNIVGIHIHNGDEHENSPIHLVDIQPSVSPHDAISIHPPHPKTGHFTENDLCPLEDPGEKIHDTVTLNLAGHVMQHDDYLPIVDFGDEYVKGHMLLRVPCNSDGLPSVLPVVGHLDHNATKSILRQMNLQVLHHISDMGKTCVYISDVPSSGGGHVHEDDGAGHEEVDRVSSVGLYNVCENNMVFRTANIATFVATRVLGQISDDPYLNENSIFPENGTASVTLPNGTTIHGDSCVSGGGPGHDDHDHDDDHH